MLWVQLPLRAVCTISCDKVCQWLAAGQWFSPGPPVFSGNKTDRHDITEILLKVALNIIKPTNNQPIHDRSLSRYFYKEWRVKTSLMSTKNSSRTMPIICIIYRKIPEVRTTTDGVLRDHSKDRVKMWNINLRNDDRFTHYNQGRSQRLYLCYSAS
jgi:hypothetical protein